MVHTGGRETQAGDPGLTPAAGWNGVRRTGSRHAAAYLHGQGGARAEAGAGAGTDSSTAAEALCEQRSGNFGPCHGTRSVSTEPTGQEFAPRKACVAAMTGSSRRGGHDGQQRRGGRTRRRAEIKIRSQPTDLACRSSSPITRPTAAGSTRPCHRRHTRRDRSTSWTGSCCSTCNSTSSGNDEMSTLTATSAPP